MNFSPCRENSLILCTKQLSDVCIVHLLRYVTSVTVLLLNKTLSLSEHWELDPMPSCNALWLCCSLSYGNKCCQYLLSDGLQCKSTI